MILIRIDRIIKETCRSIGRFLCHWLTGPDWNPIRPIWSRFLRYSRWHVMALMPINNHLKPVRETIVVHERIFHSSIQRDGRANNDWFLQRQRINTKSMLLLYEWPKLIGCGWRWTMIKLIGTTSPFSLARCRVVAGWLSSVQQKQQPQRSWRLGNTIITCGDGWISYFMLDKSTITK